jgi:hypothetical protein
MSSSSVRTAITNFITTELSGETLIDLTAEFEYLNDLLDRYNAKGDAWLGMQFIANPEEPIGLAADNTQGMYLEEGLIYLHVVDVAYLGVASSLLSRAEAIRTKFRGQRIGDIVIEATSPPNFEAGGTLQFEGGYTACSVLISYSRRFTI